MQGRREGPGDGSRCITWLEVSGPCCVQFVEEVLGEFPDKGVANVEEARVSS